MKKIFFLALVCFLFSILFLKQDEKENKHVHVPKYEYGILVDSFKVIKDIVKPNQTLGEILYFNHIDHPQINKIVKASKNIFDVRRINAGQNYTVICSRDSIDKAKFFIYEIDPVNYVVFDLTKDMSVFLGKKDIEVRLKKAKGDINNSLWIAMEEKGLSPRLTHELSTIYAWTIDFFKIQKGDAFKVYYEDRYIDNKYIGIGKIIAAEFIHNNKSYFAYYYKEKNNRGDYFNEKGETLRKAFLMAPVDYKRISSRYSKNRKHPVTGRWKGHFGTDYAAATGTPIWTTADGVVTKASYTRNNGNYVKIKHNNTYTTQYLHMSKIKSGIKRNVKVKQGQIIGYVGSTGLATGPHVCYRFWKNGRQVDPYKQTLPPGDPIKKENFEDFMIVKDSLSRFLSN
ncbi:MAG: peptidase M23 [Flavobacteriales bacterium]|nr:peptidase M23 [Flavobacteriales bacterium]|tara:strand:- start:12471 stop:13667 length:1197 start_codon:yes stop_codon:yes gene_type:complete